jgi:hypothetical protein
MGHIKRPKHGPEWHIQRRLKTFLKTRGWMVEQTHGNLFQDGFPDLLIAHPRWGQRWIDCKVEGRYQFTKAQRRKWPIWDRFGIGIWILTDATQEEYDKLFQPPNWKDYWKDSYGVTDIEELLQELDHADSDETE